MKHLNVFETLGLYLCIHHNREKENYICTMFALKFKNDTKEQPYVSGVYIYGNDIEAIQMALSIANIECVQLIRFFNLNGNNTI